MSFEEDIFDITRLKLQGDFDSQVSLLLSAIRLTRQEVEDLQQLLNDVKLAFNRCWRGCVVHPFGSVITGLGIKGSDVDCYVAIPPGMNIDKKVVYKAKACLQAYPYIFSELCAIPMAKVPIVKFHHIPTSTNGDVNFKSPSGVQNSKLLAYLLHAHPKALPLAVLIKYWSKVHKLTGTNLMPSYALTLLVVFFLQVQGLLPAVHSLQVTLNQNMMVENWNVAFRELNFTPKYQSDTLFKLLGEFFVYYNNFDFSRQVICPYLGRPVSKNCFHPMAQHSSEPTPPQFHLYKNNLAHGLCQPLKIDSTMVVQDPFEHCRNCAVAVFPRLGQKILKLFKISADYYRQGESEFLNNILTVHASEEEVKPQAYHAQRGVHKRIKETFQTRKNLKNKVMLMYNQFKNKK